MPETVAKRVKTRFKFLQEVVGELKKVTWLSRREVVHLTVIVLIVTVLSGLFFGFVDYGFSKLIDFFVR